MNSLVGLATSSNNKLLQFKVKQEEDLLLAIEEALEVSGANSGVVLVGIGALKRAIFRNLKTIPEKFPVTELNRVYPVIEKPMELLSLNGWFQRKTDNKLAIHLHFTASGVGDLGEVFTIGGHLTEGTITGLKCFITAMVTDEEVTVIAFDDDIKAYDIAILNEK